MDYYEVLVIPFKILFIFKKRKRWIKPMTCDPIPILAPIPDGMIAIDVTVAKINEDVVTALGVTDKSQVDSDRTKGVWDTVS